MMMWRVLVMTDADDSKYLVQAATVTAAITKAVKRAFRDEEPDYPLTVTAEKAEEGVLLEE